jgi:hypothetical protein
MKTSPKMELRIWNLLLDPYDHEQLADNWAKVDAHDHSPGRGVLIPTEGIAFEAINFPLLASSVFPTATASGGEVTISAEEGKALAGGPSLEVKETGHYEIALTLEGEATENVFAKLQGYISRGAAKTEFELFKWASATKEAVTRTTNFTRAELTEGDVLSVWCVKGGAGHAKFSNASIRIWRVA